MCMKTCTDAIADDIHQTIARTICVLQLVASTDSGTERLHILLPVE